MVIHGRKAGTESGLQALRALYASGSPGLSVVDAAAPLHNAVCLMNCMMCIKAKRHCQGVI
jgi:hypothetical protein